MSTGGGTVEVPYWKRKTTPVDKIALASLIALVMGGVYMASYLPKHAPSGPVYALLAASGALLVAACIGLTTIRPFAWDRFWLVLRWVVVEYIVEAGMLEYVFTYDHVRGGMLAVLSIALFIFACDIPLIMAFTVGKYSDPHPAAS